MYDCDYDSAPFVGMVPLGGLIGGGDCDELFPPIDP